MSKGFLPTLRGQAKSGESLYLERWNGGFRSAPFRWVLARLHVTLDGIGSDTIKNGLHQQAWDGAAVRLG